MLFNSLEFLVFLPTAFTLYWLLSKKSLRIQNSLVLLASLTFYGWWDWRFVSLIIFSTVVDYFCGLAIFKARSKRLAKRYLIISICSNLGILGFFKYFNFFIESWVALWSGIGFQVSISTLHIILPVGISFYTFQTMSYTIDIYRKQLRPTSDFISFFTFVSFFPQLVAGPIERASSLLPQILTHRMFDYNQAMRGLYLIVWGLFKKVAVGDNIGLIVDSYYNNVSLYSQNPLLTLISLVFYSFQIYCDFSGYSDIAIGTAQLFGIKLNTNFQRPYFSKTFSEFWRRWHISLSTWLRDYLYIPLGGNRHGLTSTYKNLTITMLLGGLWHGASFNFVVWGGLHGILLSLERLMGSQHEKWPKLLIAPVIFLIVSMVWVPFRSLTLSDTAIVFSNLFVNTPSLNLPISYFDLIEGIFLISLVLGVDLIEERGKNIHGYFTSILWIMLLILIGNWRSVSFIYFQF